MKINGSLRFDDSGLSQIENLRVEKLSSLPTFGSSDVGRLVYVTGTQVMWLGGATSWISLATGGNADSILEEINRIEASLGGLVNADGSFNAAALTGTLADSTSITNLFEKLQALAAANATAISAETTRATGEETRIEGLVTAEVTRATGEETRIEGLVDAEETRATAAETALGGRVDAEAAAREAADTALGGRVDAEETRAKAAEAANAAAVVTEREARITGDEALGDRIDDEEARATAAEQALDGRITTEVSDRTAAVNTVAQNLATEISDRTTAVTAVETALGNEVTRATAAEAAIRGELASALVGLSWEYPVDLIATDAAANVAGKPDGYRIVDTTLNRIFTVRDGALDAGEALVDGAAFFNRTNDVGYTFNGTEVVPFSGASSFVAGAGLSLSGNTVNVGNTDGSITVTADNIAVSAAVRKEITDNAAAIAAEEDRATTAEAGLDDRIDDEVQARIDAIAGEVTARDAAIKVEADRAKAAEAALGARVDEEVTAREAGDAAATQAVTTERDRALAAETALGGRVDAEAAAREAAITEVEGDLADEVTRATAAETALGGRVDGVNSRLGKLYFLYDGSTAAASHAVAHNLGVKYCNVTVVDSTDNVVIPQAIIFGDNNNLTVTFNSAIACRVVVMGFAAV
jgi:hypothetical protein